MGSLLRWFIFLLPDTDSVAASTRRQRLAFKEDVMRTFIFAGFLVSMHVCSMPAYSSDCPECDQIVAQQQSDQRQEDARQAEQRAEQQEERAREAEQKAERSHEACIMETGDYDKC
jgi:hypothetical protein